MATQLQIRRGTAAQVAAFTGAEGEIVYNSTNDSLHTNDGSTAGGFELARVDGSNFALTSAISTTANFSFGDNDKAIFGAGSDLQIYHDGSNSYISEGGTGNLFIDGTNLYIRKGGGLENYIDCLVNGEVNLYHDGLSRLSTTSYGVDIAGRLVTTSHIDAPDNARIRLGDSDDLQIYHDGSNSYITDAGTGSLIIDGSTSTQIKGSTFVILRSSAGENMAVGNANGSFDLYYDNALKISTTSTGIDVTGVITTDGLTTSADINFGDSDKAIFGAGSDLQIYHDGSNSYIRDTGTGNLNISADQLRVLNAGNNEIKAGFTTDGAVDLYHNNALKLSTTSTGINVTGTATMDGLVSSGDLLVGRTSAFTTARLEIQNDETLQVALNNSATNSDGQMLSLYSVGGLVGGIGNTALNLNIYRGAIPAININNSTGDIQFYEDTGTTAKLTWDASAESLNFADNGKAQFGASNDLQIYHDGSNSYVQDSGDGSLILNTTNGGGVYVYSAGETMATFNSNGAVNLYHDNAAKLATTSTGINVTGEITADGIALGDSQKATFGASDDLQIYHDGSNSYISDVGTGSLTLRGTNLFLQNGNGSQDYITCSNGGAINIKHAGALKLATTTTGIDVTGTATMDAAKVETSTTSTVTISESTGSGTAELRFVATDSFPKTKIVTDVSAASLSLETLGNDRLKIANNGDISFYNTAGTSQALFWDSSAESLGIGTTTVNADLHLGAASPHIDIGPSAGNRGKIGYNTNNVYIGSTSSTGEIHFKNNIGSTDAPNASGDTKMVITDSNVGIGTASPSTALHVNQNGDNNGITLSNDLRGTAKVSMQLSGTSNEDYSFRHYDGTDTDVLSLHGRTQHIFNINNAEAMRISGGNVLVGKTTDAFGTAGIALRGTVADFTRDGGTPINVNRLTSDGSLIDFHKSGAVVGSIVAYYGDMKIGTGDTGIIFGDGQDAIYPGPVSSAGARDAAIDLGLSTARFKDAYLSGGVYLGGTGAANKLDDYEEGTWTPSLGGTWSTNPTTLVGSYTKIGNVVHIVFNFSGGVKGSIVGGYFTGLPFITSQSGTGSVTDSGVNDKGNCLFFNTDRVWVTANAFSGATYITGTYTTTA